MNVSKNKIYLTLTLEIRLVNTTHKCSYVQMYLNPFIVKSNHDDTLQCDKGAVCVVSQSIDKTNARERECIGRIACLLQRTFINSL